MGAGGAFPGGNKAGNGMVDGFVVIIRILTG